MLYEVLNGYSTQLNLNGLFVHKGHRPKIVNIHSKV